MMLFFDLEIFFNISQYREKETIFKKTLDPTVDKRAKYFSSNAVGKKDGAERREETNPGNIRAELARGRQAGPFATRGRPKVADARTPGPKGRQSERAVVGGTKRRTEPRSLGETWWPRPTRRPPEDAAREPRLLFSTRLPISLIKLSRTLLRENSTSAILISRFDAIRNNYCKYIDFNLQRYLFFHLLYRNEFLRIGG